MRCGTNLCADKATIRYKGFCVQGRTRVKTWHKILSVHIMQYGFLGDAVKWGWNSFKRRKWAPIQGVWINSIHGSRSSNFLLKNVINPSPLPSISGCTHIAYQYLSICIYHLWKYICRKCEVISGVIFSLYLWLHGSCDQWLWFPSASVKPMWCDCSVDL